MSSFKLEIVTPTEINEIENASYIRCPGTDGSFGIMKGHRDAVIALGVGEIKICLLYTSPSPRDSTR